MFYYSQLGQLTRKVEILRKWGENVLINNIPAEQECGDIMDQFYPLSTHRYC